MRVTRKIWRKLKNRRIMRKFREKTRKIAENAKMKGGSEVIKLRKF